MAVILQRQKGVRLHHDVQRRMEHCMDLWEKSDYTMLVEDTIKGKLWQAIRWVTGRDKGGLLLLSDTDTNTGLTVKEVLLSKHSNPTLPQESAFDKYEELPALIDLDITAGTVKHIASRIQGSAGLGGVEAVSWQDWLLRFRAASLKLREAVAKLMRWLANTQPAWAAYWALVAGRLIALDKCPDVRP
eukprot:15333566-Ditylum_brightwellii.AAC.2